MPVSETSTIFAARVHCLSVTFVKVKFCAFLGRTQQFTLGGGGGGLP
jgi:hypothetical protein